MTATDTTKIFADRLDDLMKEKGVTTRTLAAEIGISHSSIGQYTLDGRECGINNLVKIAKYFNVSADYLLGLESGKTHNISNLQELTHLSQNAAEILLSNCDSIFEGFRKGLELLLLDINGRDFLEYLYALNELAEQRNNSEIVYDFQRFNKEYELKGKYFKDLEKYGFTVYDEIQAIKYDLLDYTNILIKNILHDYNKRQSDADNELRKKIHLKNISSNLEKE